MNAEIDNPFAGRLAEAEKPEQPAPLAVVPKAELPSIPIGPNGVEFTSVDSMYRFAQCYIQSGYAPRHISKPQQLVILWAKAAELGLRPMQAIEDLVVINNQPTMRVNLQLALVEASGKMKHKDHRYEGEGEELSCIVTMQRKGRKPQEYSYSIKKARVAGLAGKDNWLKYPEQMILQRALGFALRGEFADVLKGIKPTEEVEDYSETINNGH